MYGLKAWQEPGPNSHTQARACPVQADRVQVIGPASFMIIDGHWYVTSHVQALQGSASPRSGPDGYHGKGKQGRGPEKGLTPDRERGSVIH